MLEAEREFAVGYYEASPEEKFLSHIQGSCATECELEEGTPPLSRQIMSSRQESSHRLDSVLSATDSGYSGIEDHSTPFHSFIEHAMTFTFPVLFVLASYSSVVCLHELNLLWLIIPAVPFTWALGDFVTGTLHWAADTYGSEETPIFGQSIIKPFRLHHHYPRDICTHNLVVTVGNSCLIAVPALAACLYVLWSYEASSFVTLTIFIIVLLTPVTVATNLFHKLAHQENSSGIIRWLQQKRIILSPAHHDLHHASPFDTHYCITNGWLNPALQKLKFFRGLEIILSKFGIKAAPLN
ncbi:MAG TPA: fatty acid desaturase CarF family protein [Pyrinomonadaceae bacterium]|nr:fatty acid desaturase CarF family protein [Pyrinomonadaceae bacterium]